MHKGVANQQTEIVSSLDCILGVDFLSRHKMKLDFTNLKAQTFGILRPKKCGNFAIFWEKSFEFRVRKDPHLITNTLVVPICLSIGSSCII